VGRLPGNWESIHRSSGYIIMHKRFNLTRGLAKALVLAATLALPLAGATPSSSDSRPAGYQYFIGVVGNPSVPDISWSDEQLEQIKALGVNMVQLSIAWGGKPANEVINLEDLDQEQREKFSFRIRQAKKHGLKTIAHFGIPKMLNFNPVQPACVLDNDVLSKYETMLGDFMTSFPEVDDVLVYTFDQQAWLCSEFGPCPRCTGMPLDERVPDFLNLLKDTMRRVRPQARLWWKPWELSKGQVTAILKKITPENFGLVLNPSTSNEVYPFNDRSFKSDLGVKRFAQLAHERGVPVIGEFDHTLYKPLYLMEDFFPRLIYEQMVEWKAVKGLVGIKEYYGFAPETFSVNAAMLQAWIKSPDASLERLLAGVAAPYGKAASLMVQAWEANAQAVEAFPWDTTYLIGPMGLDRRDDISHDWNPVDIPSATWDTPIWKANRRANFMLTDEYKAHPWLFEDAGLRLEDSAALAFKAVEFYDRALLVSDPGKAADVRQQRLVVWKMARSLRSKGLHFLETLAAQDARTVQNDPKQFELVRKRLEELLKRDVQNQDGAEAVAKKLADFQRDPTAWLRDNLNPRVHETRTQIDWSKWVPRP